MTWQKAYNDDFLEVYVNGLLKSPMEYNFYRYENSFIKIKFLDYVNQGEFWVNGERYEGFADGEEIIIEISNLVRSVSGGDLTVENTPDGSGAINVLIEFNSIAGEPLSGTNFQDLPEVIPFNSLDGSNFWLQTCEAVTFFDTDGDPVEKTTFLDDYDYLLNSAFYNLSGYCETTADKKVTLFEEFECWDDKILVEWVSRFGVKKSWWFEVEKELHSSDKMITTETMDSSLNAIKNKRYSMIVRHRMATQRTQNYLSDLVLSDTVYVFKKGDNEKTMVRVETNAFEVSKQKKDVQFTLNISRYDTI